MRELGPMRGKGNNKRGFTLAEMAIALAVTAVLLVSITTLVIMIAKESGRNAKDSEITQQTQLVRTLVTGWFGNYSGQEYTIACTEHELVASRDGAEAGRLRYDAEAGRMISNGIALGVAELRDVRFQGYENGVIKVAVTYSASAAPMVILLRSEVQQP